MKLYAAGAFLFLLAACQQASAVALGASDYNTLLVSGQKIGNVTFGLLMSSDRKKPIYANNWEAGQQLDVLDISQAPDHTALVQIGNDYFATIITDFFPPSTSYVAQLDMDAAGALSVRTLKNVDWAGWGGIWLPCSGHVVRMSPKKAIVMVGEEYENNARHIATANSIAELRAAYETDPYYYGYADVANFMRYYNRYPFNNTLGLPVVTIKDIKSRFKPYQYGYIAALELGARGSTKVSKYMTMGRFSHEFGYVMPDNRTVYLSDDHGSGGGFFRFVADAPGDFTSGKLYAMRARQTSKRNGPASASSFAVSWILLGTGNNAQLRAAAKNTTFLDLFEVASGNATAGTCPEGFRSVNTATGFECLKLKPGMSRLAAFFETRRLAALRGATTEFSKGEGMVYDKDTNSLYLAISVVRYGMEDFAKRGKAGVPDYDAGGPNHVRVQYNKCGCIYQLPVDANYTATSMTAFVCGVGLDAADAAGNTCDASSIAAPDNLDLVDGHLIVAEDSEGLHVKSFLWAIDIKTRALTRIFSTPTNVSVSYAELTSTYTYTLGGRRYMVANVNNWDFHAQIPGRVGYFGPFPADQPITFEPEARSGAAAARRAMRAVQLDASADMVAAEAVRGRGVGGKAYERGWPEFESGEL